MLLRLLTVFIALTLTACASDSNDNAGTPGGNEGGSGTEAPRSREVQCGVIDLPEKDMRYCFQDLKGQVEKNTPEVNIVYFFHGLGGSEFELFGPNGKVILQGLAQTFGDELPVIVGLSMGSTGVLGDETDEVAQIGLPALEQLIASGRNFRRLLLGGSLGGHNTLKLAAEAPGRFAAAAAFCPALATFNGYDDSEIQSYKARHQAILDEDFLDRAIAAYRTELTSADEWDRANPFTLLPLGAYDNLPLFLSTGREDSLGFIEGSREFRDRALTRPLMRVDYHEVSGGHCAFDIPAFLRFVDATF